MPLAAIDELPIEYARPMPHYETNRHERFLTVDAPAWAASWGGRTRNFTRGSWTDCCCVVRWLSTETAQNRMWLMAAAACGRRRAAAAAARRGTGWKRVAGRARGLDPGRSLLPAPVQSRAAAFCLFRRASLCFLLIFAAGALRVLLSHPPPHHTPRPPSFLPLRPPSVSLPVASFAALTILACLPACAFLPLRPLDRSIQSDTPRPRRTRHRRQPPNLQLADDCLRSPTHSHASSSYSACTPAACHRPCDDLVCCCCRCHHPQRHLTRVRADSHRTTHTHTTLSPSRPTPLTRQDSLGNKARLCSSSFGGTLRQRLCIVAAAGSGTQTRQGYFFVIL